MALGCDNYRNIANKIYNNVYMWDGLFVPVWTWKRDRKVGRRREMMTCSAGRKWTGPLVLTASLVRRLAGWATETPGLTCSTSNPPTDHRLVTFEMLPVPSRVIFALGISMTFINIPVEWFSVGFDWTWMLLFGDIRQGIFYSMLLSFWIIFCGEHLMVRDPAPS